MLFQKFDFRPARIYRQDTKALLLVTENKVAKNTFAKATLGSTR
jgi:hypothetical protein